LPHIAARGDIFPLNAAREPFFVKMWPAYETEFETPAVHHRRSRISYFKGELDLGKVRSTNLTEFPEIYIITECQCT